MQLISPHTIGLISGSAGSLVPSLAHSQIRRLPGLTISTFRRVWRRLRMYAFLPMFREHGKNIWFDPDGLYSFENIILGSDVSLGIRPTLMATKSTIRVGNKVMFGPNVTLIGGNQITTQQRLAGSCSMSMRSAPATSEA